MIEKISRYCDLLIEAVILVFFVGLVPLIYSVNVANGFILPKMLVFQCGIVIAFFAFIIKLIINKQLTFNYIAFDFRVVLLLVSLVLSTIISIYPRVSFFNFYPRSEGLIFRINYFILYVLIASRYSSENRFPRFIDFSVYTACIVSIIGILQYFGLTYFVEKTLRIVSTLGHWNYVGTYLLLILPLAIVRFFSIKNRAFTILYILAVFLIMTAFYFSFSRSNWIALLFAFAVLFILSGKEFLISHRKRTFVLISVFVTAVLFANIINQFNSTRLDLRTHLDNAVNLNTGSGAGRFSMWKSTLLMIGERPLLGGGLNTYSIFFPAYREDRLEDIEGKESVPDHAHNDFLDVGANQGLIGLLVYLLFTLGYFRLFLTPFLSEYQIEKEQKLYIAAILSSLIGNIVQLQFNFSITVLDMYFWIILSYGTLFLRLDHNADIKKIKFTSSKRIALSCFAVFIFIITIVSTVKLTQETMANYYYRQGEKAFVSGKADSTILFEKAIQINPYVRDYYTPLFQYYNNEIANHPKQQEIFLEKKLKIYEKLIKNNPYDIRNLYFYARICNQLKMQKEYVGTLKKIMQIDPELKYAPYEVRMSFKQQISH